MIARYRWRYSAKDGTLSVSASERDGTPADPDSKQGPIVFPTYAGRRFKARVDTGHSDSTLSAVWRTRLPDIERHETEMVGIGSTQCAATPYVRCLPLRFQEHLIHCGMWISVKRCTASRPMWRRCWGRTFWRGATGSWIRRSGCNSARRFDHKADRERRKHGTDGFLRSSAYRRRTPPHCCVSEDHR